MRARNRFEQRTSRRLQGERGSALILTMVLMVLLLLFTFALITTTQTNSRSAAGRLELQRARCAALSGISIAKSQVLEALATGSPDIAVAGNLDGIARSIEEPGQTGPNCSFPGSIEGTVVKVGGADPGSALPTAKDATALADGHFSTRTSLSSGTPITVRILSLGSYGESAYELLAVFVVDQETLFSQGMFGSFGVDVSGPGEVEWVDNEAARDPVNPVVIESSDALDVKEER